MNLRAYISDAFKLFQVLDVCDQNLLFQILAANNTHLGSKMTKYATDHHFTTLAPLPAATGAAVGDLDCKAVLKGSATANLFLAGIAARKIKMMGILLLAQFHWCFFQSSNSACTKLHLPTWRDECGLLQTPRQFA